MTKPNHYVNNELFLKEITAYRAEVAKAIAENKERPRVPEYIGQCLLKISTHLARKPNFGSYPFKEDMISDGIENCLLYIDNFDPERGTNPFAYFTQIIYYAFLRRIQKEKKHMYVKYKSMTNVIVDAMIENHGEGEDSVGSNLNSSMHEAYSENFIREFINNFEETKRKKTVTKKSKMPETGVIKFMEKDEV